MRSAAVAKRKKDTSDTNYKYILEKERINKEETVKKRKLACLGILEEIKALVIIILFRPLTLYQKKILVYKSFDVLSIGCCIIYIAISGNVRNNIYSLCV